MQKITINYTLYLRKNEKKKERKGFVNSKVKT